MITNCLSVDDVVKARCPVCGEVQNHTVIKMVDEKTARIRCNACCTTGLYNGKTPAKAGKNARKAPVSRKAREAQAAKERETWVALQPGMEEKAVVYSMTGTYHVRDVVQHGSFGLGLVTREVGPHKIEVLFEEGKKLLCCH